MMAGHVLFVPSSYPRKGAPGEGIFYRDQALALVRAGWQVGVVFPEFLRWSEGQAVPVGMLRRLRIEREVEGGVTTLRAQIWNPPIRRMRAARWSSVAARLIERYMDQEGRPDLIHAQGLLWGGVTAADVGERLAIPVVVTEHSSRFPRGLVDRWEARRIRAALPGIGALIAVSGALAAAVRPFVSSYPIEVVPNLVDVDFFAPSPTPQQPIGESVVFLAVASLDLNKGIDVLLRGFAALPQALCASKLLIVGAGPGRRLFEELSRELGVAERVAFLGTKDRMGVREALWRSHVFVLASRVETFGVAAIEAMACGLPVVATRSGGPEDFVAPPFGWTVPSGDSGLLAKAMTEAAAASVGFDRLGVRRLTVERFGERAVATKLIEVYSNVLRRGSHATR